MSVYPIERNGGRSVYLQISELLEKEVQEVYSAGDLLPSENELAERFSVNRHTLRRAVEELIAAGLIERIHGKGTVVLSNTINYTVGNNTRFTETLESKGQKTESEILNKRLIPARGSVAEKLSLEEGDQAIFIETLRKVEGVPFCLISHFLTYYDFRAVMNGYRGGSLHDSIFHSSGVRLRRIESVISSVLPQGEDALLLNMPRHKPVLRVKSLNVNSRTGEPAEYAVTRFRGDAVQLLVKP